MARYETYIKELHSNSGSADADTKTNDDIRTVEHLLSKSLGDSNGSNNINNTKYDDMIGDDRYNNDIEESDGIEEIVLKFTTVSESPEAASFTVTKDGASIGRDVKNSICIQSDQRLASMGHANIEYRKNSFYIIDGGHPFSASIRIAMRGFGARTWIMDKDVCFSTGNSIFCCIGTDLETGELIVEAVEGPLKGQIIRVNKNGATLGRSSENNICVPDRELSRKHSKIEYDEKIDRYVISDIGSTNGTYVQLVGPYGGPYKLNINDHILIGRTGFSINRYDYGLSEEIGHRQTMEDACAIVQNLNIYNIPTLGPQSFFGVFDGHGGHMASQFLSQNLHINIIEGLLSVYNDTRRFVEQSSIDTIDNNEIDYSMLDTLISTTLKNVFLETDNTFLNTSENSNHGSTATTALLLGNRVYCANVGDSRTLLCRNFSAYALSQDHKPSREDEAKRIKDAGGFIINNRVMGELAVSRAFGDCEFKKGIQSIIEEEGGIINSEDKNWFEPLITAEPDIEITQITKDDQFLLLACDGLYDVFTEEEIITFVKNDMGDHRDAQRCCQNLTHQAIRERNSRDNVSIILIILNKWY